MRFSFRSICLNSKLDFAISNQARWPSPHTPMYFVYSWLTFKWNNNACRHSTNDVCSLSRPTPFPLFPFASNSCLIWIRLCIMHFKVGIKVQPTKITPRERGHAFSTLNVMFMVTIVLTTIIEYSNNISLIHNIILWYWQYSTKPRGGYSIVKLNTTCETSLLPLYYMAQIILYFMMFFLHIYNHW